MSATCTNCTTSTSTPTKREPFTSASSWNDDIQNAISTTRASPSAETKCEMRLSTDDEFCFWNMKSCGTIARLSRYLGGRARARAGSRGAFTRGGRRRARAAGARRAQRASGRPAASEPRAHIENVHETSLSQSLLRFGWKSAAATKHGPTSHAAPRWSGTCSVPNASSGAL